MTLSPQAGANLVALAVMAAGGAALVLFAFLADAVASWSERTIFNRALGFPKEYRVPNYHPARGRSRARANLRVDSLGDATGIRVLASMTDDGLLLDVRSPFGFRLMRTVIVPWRALRLDEGPPPLRDRILSILNPDGSTAASFMIAPFDLRWRDALAERIHAGRAAPAGINTPDSPGNSSG